MKPGMFGPLLLLAASVAPVPTASPPVAARISGSLPRIGATAHARVSITIISGVRFGANQPRAAAGADRRTARLTNADGSTSSAELLEFQ